MTLSVRRIHFLGELAALCAIVATVAAFAFASADAVLRDFRDDEELALERSVIFLQSQLDDRLSVFSAYARDALRGIRPTHSPDMDAALVVSWPGLAVLDILPGEGDHPYFAGYALGSAATGEFLAGLEDGELAHSGVIRSPERDAPMICYAYRRGDAVIVGMSGIASLRDVLGRVGTVSGGAFVLASRDGFPFVATIDDYPVSFRNTGGHGAACKDGDWYVSFIEAPTLGGWLYKFSPEESIDPVLDLIRFSVLPVAFLVLLFGVGKNILERRLILLPLEALASGLAEWPASPLARPGGMARELETLYGAFGAAERRTNEVLDSLREARDQLAGANEALEARVSERTAALRSANEDLELGNRKLGETLAQLTAAQEGLLAQEKMAALGRLASGVAHELNTPLGAIMSASSRFADEAGLGSGQVVTRLRALEEAEAGLLARVVDLIVLNAASAECSPDKAVLDGLRKLLADRPPHEARKLASEMAAMGLDASVPEALELAGSRSAAELLSLAESVTSSMRALRIVRLAASNAARVVDALRSYSWEGAGDRPQPVDLGVQLSDVLLIMNDRIKRGCSLERDLPRGLVVMADPDRLAQVWINLVNNALQAMAGSGTLGVRVAAADGEATVTVSDDGPGIPADLQPRIFEPFFTTKPKGEGTGLGLDICRRLVTAAGGRIGFESRPGRTVFSVSLPLCPPGTEDRHGA